MSEAKTPPTPSIYAELSLFALTCVTVVGMSRLFVDNTIVPYLLTTAVLAHGVAAVLRRLRWNPLAAVAVNIVSLGLLLLMSRYPDTLTWRLVPTRLTWTVLQADLSQAWEAFGIVRAPTETLAGFVAVSMIAIWLLVQLADTAAFRLQTTVEAIVPMGTIFIFTSLLDNDRSRLPATVFFLAAVLAFSLTHRGRARAQVAGTHEPLHGREIRNGAGIALASIAVAALLGPMLPGVDEEPLLNWRSIDGSGPAEDRVTLSPLVDARGRLVGQSDLVVFTVRSDVRSYWRTTSLDSFDGVVWGAKYNVSEVDGALPAEPFEGESDTFEQTFEIEALSDVWLPAAFSATNIETSLDDVRYESSSSTLLLGSRDRTEKGQTYTITSVRPSFNPDELRNASTTYPQEIIERYLPLPPSFSSEARLLAESLTIDAETNYDKALAIQQYFRTFDYDLNVAEGHSNRRIATFLEERVGYCEQFAGTMAGMARALGIPSRVAVGFTPGDEIEPGLFEVRGRHYHAWPELYFPGSGWVYFEPTPNRGAPGAEAWTLGAEAQVSAVNPNLAETPADRDIPLGLEDQPETPDPADLADINAEEEFADFDIATGTSGSPQWVTRMLIVALVLLGALALWAISVPLLRRRRSKVRHSNNVAPEQIVQNNWEDANEALGLMGIRAYDSETRSEFADRVSQTTPLRNGHLSSLATMTDRCIYQAHEPGADDLAESSTLLLKELDDELAEMCSAGQRLRHELDPRPLIPSWPARLSGAPDQADF